MTSYLNVYLDGVLAGQLAQAPGGAMTFTYDSTYSARRSPTPLSLSMPLSGSRHSNRVVSAWLEGLLPDNLAVREEWGRRFEVSPRNPFALLRHVGRDAAGAVQVLPVDVYPPDAAQRTGNVRRLSEREASELLLTLTVRDDGWQVGESSGRWSAEQGGPTSPGRRRVGCPRGLDSNNTHTQAGAGRHPLRRSSRERVRVPSCRGSAWAPSRRG